jgi:hypothetical protein
MPALRRGHDSPPGALRAAPLLGLGHRSGALPVRADGALHRGDPGAGLHLAGWLRPESVDDASAVGSGRERRQAAALHHRVAAMGRRRFTSCRSRAGCGVPMLAGAGDGQARRAGVRGSRARCMRVAGRARARSPPPPSRVVSSMARRKASTIARGPAHIHEGRREESVANERSQP